MRSALAPNGSWLGVPAERIELISRGDIVNGILARSGPGREPVGQAGSSLLSPLLVVAHDAGGSSSSPELRPIASWAAAGIALVAIDLPLHGHRASAKLSERLITSIARQDRGETLDPNSAVLVEEFRRQATIDLIRTVDALLGLGDFDPKRVGFLGLGLGARLGRVLLDWDDRLCAAMLVDDSTHARAATAASPATSPPSRPDPSALSIDRVSGAWPAEARAYLGSRLGF